MIGLLFLLLWSLLQRHHSTKRWVWLITKFFNNHNLITTPCLSCLWLPLLYIPLSSQVLSHTQTKKKKKKPLPSPTMAAKVSLLVSSILLLLSISLSVNALSSNYYDHTCPQLESIVTHAVKQAMSNDKTVPAALLRMHFHDCFIRVI